MKKNSRRRLKKIFLDLCIYTRGGYHTFLVSKGEVFEVHWDQEGSRLYGKKLFKDYEWLSGALIVPPDSTFTSDGIKAR